MSFFSFLTGGAKQTQKIRLRSEERRLETGKQRLLKAESVRRTMADQLSLHKALTILMLRPYLKRFASSAGVPSSEFKQNGRYSLFSEPETRARLETAERALAHALSNIDRVAFGLFAAGASLNILSELDHRGILNIPDWHRPLAEVIGEVDLPGGDLLLEAAAEIGADTILDVVGDLTIVLGLAKGAFNLFKTAEFAERADTVAASAAHLEEKLALHEASLSEAKLHGEAYDKSVYSIFKTLVILRALRGKVLRTPRAVRDRVKASLAADLDELRHLNDSNPFAVSVVA